MSKHSISLQQAVEMTSRYRKEKGLILKPEVDKNTLPISETFDKAAFESLTGQAGCVGIRCYFGMDEEKNVRVLFVGVNDKNEDMLPGSGNNSIEEVGVRCPPVCPAPSPLNE